MEPKYPVFILTDDRSVLLASNPTQLGACIEPNDIDTGECSGWDSDGRPLRLFHVGYKESQAELSGAPPEPDRLRQAVRHYAEEYASGFPLPDDFGESDNMAQVLLEIEAYIRKNQPPGLVERMSRWLRGGKHEEKSRD